MDRHRIYFELDSKDWHGANSEGIWAESVAGSDGRGLFRLLNSPFFATGVSHLDVVEASTDGITDRYVFKRVKEHAGHSTYMVLEPIELMRFKETWRKLEQAGCLFESTTIDTSFGQMSLYSIDVPKTTDIRAVFTQLKRAAESGRIMLQTGHIGHQ